MRNSPSPHPRSQITCFGEGLLVSWGTLRRISVTAALIAVVFVSQCVNKYVALK